MSRDWFEIVFFLAVFIPVVSFTGFAIYMAITGPFDGWD